MSAFTKTGQLLQMIFLILALTVLWSAESWIENKEDSSNENSPVDPDDLSEFGIGSLVGS